MIKDNNSGFINEKYSELVNKCNKDKTSSIQRYSLTVQYNSHIANKDRQKKNFYH